MSSTALSPDRLFGWLTWSALGAAALGTASVLPLEPRAMGITSLLSLVIATTLILVRQRSERLAVRRTLTLLLLVVAPLLWVNSFGPLLIPLQLVALVQVVEDWSVVAGLLDWGALALFTLALHLASGGHWARAINEAVGILAVIGFGLVFALLLRSLAEARARDRVIMAELDAANARLVRALDIEKELVLADERARMSRELHDGLGHRLTLVSMRLELAERLADREPAASRAAVRDCRGLVVESIDAMRMWVRALNPIREPGLTGRAAMEGIADSFRTTGLAVELRGTGDPAALDEAAELLGYRVLQEGLTNALRHSEARQVTIELTDQPDAARRPGLQIKMTNPLGPAPRDDQVISRGSFGLRSLAERAGELGGQLTAGAIGERFELAVWLPKGNHD